MDRTRWGEKALATSDELVGLGARGPGRVGIGSAHAVVFPVDRRTGLMMLDEGGRDEVRTPTASVAFTITRVTLASARLAVFHHPGDEPLNGFELPPSPRLVGVDIEAHPDNTAAGHA